MKPTEETIIHNVGLELKDWKEMELQCRQQMRDGMKMMIASGEILNKAVQMIRELGGKTWEEERKDVKSQTRKAQINNTSNMQ